MDKYRTTRYGAIMTVLSSISHIGETDGNEAPFRRETMSVNGRNEEIPVISGNSIRGTLRDNGMRLTLDYLDILVPLDEFYMLFSGGALSKTSGAMGIVDARKLRETLPILSLFGTAVGRQMLPGAFRCGKILPIAEETASLIPEAVLDEAHRSGWKMPSIYDIMQEESYTRKDDAKDERLSEYLSTRVGKNDAPQQMRYSVETMIPGTKLWWHVTLVDATDEEHYAFLASLAAWGKNPELGGMGRVGHGLVSLEPDGYLNGITINPNASIAPPVPNEYLEVLDKNRDDIIELLHAVEV